MSETKFTPGPWDRDEGDFSIYQLDTSEPITEAMNVVKNGDANSLLIAAAPKLYEALDALVNLDQRCGWHSKEADEAIAALAKARGDAP